MYSETYRFAFGKDRSFFYENDVNAIRNFLNESYFCEGLIFRTKLLTTLLHNDALLQSKEVKKDFLKKSRELEEYLKQLPI